MPTSELHCLTLQMCMVSFGYPSCYIYPLVVGIDFDFRIFERRRIFVILNELKSFVLLVLMLAPFLPINFIILALMCANHYINYKA